MLGKVSEGLGNRRQRRVGLNLRLVNKIGREIGVETNWETVGACPSSGFTLVSE